MLRLFVACNLSPEVNAKIAAATDPNEPGVAWIRPENLHLTVKFLGATDPQKVPAIIEVMRLMVVHLPFNLHARGSGAFPDERHARVLWVGIEDPSEKLARLATDLEERLSVLGVPRESRAFVPHLTVARIKSGRPALKFLERYRQFDFGVSVVSDLILYESKTLPSGPLYAPLFVIKAGQTC